MEYTDIVEKQYVAHVRTVEKKGIVPIGVMQSGSWHTDPRHLLFSLSRYKFAAKMLSGKERVLEVGCCAGFMASIVLQEVGHVHGVDIDPVFIAEAQQYEDASRNFTCQVHDMLQGPLEQKFQAAYCLDVLEHIPLELEHVFLRNVTASLSGAGELVLGMPSLESQQYASAISREGHVNCKSAPELKSLMQQYFRHVFLFSMNDEVVHTGFSPLAHYFFTVCAGRIQ